MTFENVILPPNLKSIEITSVCLLQNENAVLLCILDLFKISRKICRDNIMEQIVC